MSIYPQPAIILLNLMSTIAIFGHYDSLSVNGLAIVMAGFNGDLGNSLGDTAKHEPNQGGLKSLDFANYFNL